MAIIKDVVYSRKVRDLADLRQRLIEAVELITPHMLINTWQKLENRLDHCGATTGAHIEGY
jgi:aspartate carbamoyltransferase catalytic subunit